MPWEVSWSKATVSAPRRVPPSVRQWTRSLTTSLLESHLGGAPIQDLELPVGDADVRVSRHGSRLKSVTPRGAGHPPQSEMTFGRYYFLCRRVRFIRIIYPGDRGCMEWATCCLRSS